CARPLARADGDTSAVVVDDPPDDGQPESGAARLRRHERLEDTREHAGRDAPAGVAHAYLGRASRRTPLHGEDAAVPHRLHSLEKQVPEDLPELIAVGGHRAEGDVEPSLEGDGR